MHSFGAGEPLSAVRMFVQQKGGLVTKHYAMQTAHPRRTYDEEDMRTTLRELGLCPSAVVHVVFKEVLL